MDEIKRRLAALHDKADRITKQFDRILKDGEGCGPTADAVHVPAPMGGKKPKKKKDAADV